MSDPWAGLPKRLKIIGKRYTVSVVEKVDEEGSDGESSPLTNTLLVKQQQAFENARETVLHEAIHAVEHQMGLDLKEVHVEGLGVGILALLRENKAFVRWLMAAERD